MKMNIFGVRGNNMQYLMIDDLSRLREKLTSGIAPLDFWWPHFLKLARHHSETFPLFPALAYIVTGEAEFAELAKDRILAHIRLLLPFEYSVHVQAHTWCNAHPLARTAIAFDWVVDSGVFSPEEKAEITEAFIDYAYKHPYMVAQSRVESDADNQLMAMCFACAVIGYLFGIKRGKDSRAVECYAYGISRVPNLVGYSDHGGYSHEGSTYMDQIVMPSAALLAAFMESVTGEDFLERRYPPNNSCLREALEMDAKMISPGGLMPPWDHYGYQRAMNKCGIAYLARKSGNHAWLSLITQLEMWAEDDEIAWGKDDKMWTLLWWPDDAHIPIGTNPFPSWVVENTAAALDAPEKSLRLFQYWDRCGADYHCGRPQVNPNSFVLEAFGSPFLMDGTPDVACRHFDYQLAQVAPYISEEQMELTLHHFAEIGREITVEEWLRGWTYGCLGGANSIIVDNEPWYVPREQKEGRAVAFAAGSSLKAVTSDAADYYQPHYDVREMRRTSLLVREKYVVVRDRIAAASPHNWSWQVYARPGVESLSQGFRIATPEMTQCDIIPAAPYPQRRQTVKNYTFTLEGDADLLQFSRQGCETSFAVCLAPSMCLEEALDITAGWRAGVELDEGDAHPWQKTNQQGTPVSLSELVYFAADAPMKAWRWLQQNVARPNGERIYLRVDKAIPSARLWVNGEEIPLQVLGMLKFSDRLAPLVVDITDALADGDNLLVLAARPTQGKTFAGKAGLFRSLVPLSAPIMRELSPGCLQVEWDNQRDLLLIDSPGDFAGEGWETDAWCALLAADEGAAFGATYCRGEQFIFHGTRANISWVGNTLDCGDLSNKADIWCCWPGGEVHVESSGIIRVSGAPGVRLCWYSNVVKPVFANGQVVQYERDSLCQQYSIVIPKACTATANAVHERWRLAIDLAWQPGDEARRKLEELLNDEWWTVRCAAALSLGRRRDARSIPAIDKAMRADMARDNYPPMAGRPDAADLLNAPDDMASVDAQEHFVKRWRFLMCGAIALGEIGEQAGVAVLCDLLERKIDFYPAQANTCLALGKIGDPAALPILRRYVDTFEVNTGARAKAAVATIEALHPETTIE